MIQESFVINVALKFATIQVFNNHQFLLCLHVTNMLDMPMSSAAYVQKVMWSATLLTFGINCEYKTNCSSNVFTRCLIN